MKRFGRTGPSEAILYPVAFSGLLIISTAANASAIDAPIADVRGSSAQCGADTTSCPNACKTVTVICTRQASGAPDLCNGASYCVRRSQDGNCVLGVPERSGSGALCGRSFDSPDGARDYVDYFRNSLRRIIDDILRDPALTAAEKMAAIYQLLMESCSLQDELLHIFDQYACLHHRSCGERQSGISNFECATGQLTTELIQYFLGALPDTRDQFLRGYCNRVATTLAGLNYDGCVCDIARSSCTPLTSEQCASCLDTCVSRSKEKMAEISLCTGQREVTDDTIERACRSFLDPNRGGGTSHSCFAYVGVTPPATPAPAAPTASAAPTVLVY